MSDLHQMIVHLVSIITYQKWLKKGVGKNASVRSKSGVRGKLDIGNWTVYGTGWLACCNGSLTMGVGL